jgi:AbrB family looped-hinge helix DNA binding protein
MMRAENITRRLDNLGRIVLPKNLRLRAGILEGDELEIFTTEENGRCFICLTKKDFDDPRYDIARDVLRELGLEIPSALVTEN